jgi:hypothetical protein
MEDKKIGSSKIVAIFGWGFNHRAYSSSKTGIFSTHVSLTVRRPPLAPPAAPPQASQETECQEDPPEKMSLSERRNHFMMPRRSGRPMTLE